MDIEEYSIENLSKNQLENLEKSQKLNKIINESDNLFIILDEEIQKIRNKKYRYLCICKYCGRLYFSGSPSGCNCSHCKIEFVCKNCNERKELNKRYIDFENLDELKNFICTPCNRSIARDNLKGPGICTGCFKYSNNRNYYGHCKKCAKISSQNVKNGIEKKKEAGKCVKCFRIVEERDALGRCKKCHDNWYKEHNSSDEMKKVQAENGKKVTKERTKPGKCTRCLQFKEKRNSAGVCSDCMSKETLENKSAGICSVCLQYFNQRDSMGRCLECRNKSLEEWRNSEEFHQIQINNGYTTTSRNSKKDQICEKCGKIFHSPFIMKLGPCCNPNLHQSNFIYLDVLYYKDEPVNQIIEKLESGEYNPKDFSGWNKRFCKTCGKFEWHYETECLICGNKNKLDRSKFLVYNGVKYYEDEPVEDVARKILSGEYNIEDFPHFNIRFGLVCYGTEDIVTGEHYYLSGQNFKLVEGIKCILNPKTGQYEPADEFLAKINREKLNIDPNEEVQNFIDNEGFSIEMIVKTGKDSWSRSKTDYSLVKNGYGWMVYIKLLDGHPWIVDKTGKKKVLKSGIDFNFIITDEKNPNNPDYAGAGREYARIYHPDRVYSDFDFVLYKKFLKEQEALEFEAEMMRKYNLFAS